MNREEHRQVRESLGAFALNQLTETEHTAVQSHVDGCADCRAELAAIAPLAGPLRRVDPERLGSPSPPPDGLRESIVDRMRTERPARRRWTRPLTAVAAAVAVLAIGVGIGVGIGYQVAPRPADVPLEPVAVAAEQPGLTVSADLIAHTWGTEIKLQGKGFTGGEQYQVMITDAAGTERVAGEFVGTGDRTMVCNLNSAVLRDAATGFVVRDDTGTVVVSSHF